MNLRQACIDCIAESQWQLDIGRHGVGAFGHVALESS